MTNSLNRACVLVAFLAIPSIAYAHGGGLDSLGCHHNRKQGGYHCHRGPLAGRSFSSQADALKALDEPKKGSSSASTESTESKPKPAPPTRNTYTAAEAKDHVGETATVCGKVVSARYAAGSRGSPTFLNLDKPYPEPLFTVAIWGAERTSFGEPEKEYHGKDICVTGRIENYEGAPRMVVANPRQIALQAEKKP